MDSAQNLKQSMDSAQSLKQSMDSAQSLKQSKGPLEVTHKETDAISNRSNSNSSCSSNLSQDSAVSSIFQSDPPVLQPKPDVAESLGAVQTVENPSMGSLSRIQSSSRSSSQIRLSGVLGSHDPNRIPVSIFSGRPSNPMEWSTASNESLFSIHVGNNSFSREHFNFFTKSGELMMNPNSSQTPSNLPPFVEPARVESKTEVAGKTFVEPTTSTAPQIPATPSQNVSDHKKEVTTPTDELRGRQSVSNDSMNSSRSFQFPLLASEGATPKTTSSVSTDSGVTSQQQPVSKLQSKKRQSAKHQPPELQSPSQTTSTSPAMNSGSGWFSCLSWCRCR
ncbi:uncharacterized protein LOC120080199 [Benincasa hispida]|uniref:uncharacterized protein LOC120080199 n=1 Tax=Benincasa hispida TaxID=102211 RepID=UPI001902B394|nr:uncharacterized protein LOC120080199 [Benincasa hispida]